MNIDFGDGVAVTTWGVDDDGQQLWRARYKGEDPPVTFTAPRDAEQWFLHAVSLILLGRGVTEQLGDMLETQWGVPTQSGP